MPTPSSLSTLQGYTSQTSTTTISSVALSAGRTVFLLAGGNTSKYISSVTDSLGNVWTVDYAYHPTANAKTANIASCRVTTGGTATVTVTWDSSTSASVTCGILEVPGSYVFDKAGQANGTPANFAVTATGSLASSADFAIAVGQIAQTLVTLTVGSGWTGLPTNNVSQSQSTTSGEYQTLSSTATPTATGTWSVSNQASTRVLVAYQPVNTSSMLLQFP